MNKIAALADALKERTPARETDGSRPGQPGGTVAATPAAGDGATRVATPAATDPATETATDAAARTEGGRSLPGEPASSVFQPVTGNQPVTGSKTEDSSQPSADPPARPAAGKPRAGRGVLAAPMAGGGGTLAMWRPSRGLSARDRRHRVLARVDELTETVNTLGAAVQRLQVMCDLLGQCVYMAVDPRAAAHRARSLPRSGPGTAGAAAEQGRGGQGADLGAGLADTLIGLLPGLVGQSGQGSQSDGEGEPGPDGDDDPGNGPGNGGGGGDSGSVSGAGGTGQAAALSTLLPLLQSVASRGGRDDLATRLGAVMGSPAFQQLLGMVQAEGGPR